MSHYLCKKCGDKFGQSTQCQNCGKDGDVVDTDIESLRSQNRELCEGLEELCVCIASELTYKCLACKTLERATVHKEHGGRGV